MQKDNRGRILVVILAHNEQKLLGLTLCSVLNQTVPPMIVVVVDDRSSDSTFQIAQGFASRNPQVKLVRRTSESKIEHTTEIPKAFNEGLRVINDLDWDYLAKVDADMPLAPDYFERILEAFGNDDRLGICGGQTPNEPTIAVRGGNRVISRQCWKQVSVDGFMPEIDAEDSYVDLKARYRGWNIKLVPEAVSTHLRPTKQWPFLRILRLRWRIGVTCYRFGWNPFLFLGRTIRVALFEKPRIVTLPLMYLGWAWAFVRRIKIEEELRAYQNELQRERFSKIIGELHMSPLKTLKKVFEKRI
jgi:cellulose synthase/poly-beta-1,6-N-acetylglucosamine synthase-like glycosyltransferase